MSPPIRQPPDYGSPAWLYELMDHRFDEIMNRMDKHGAQLVELSAKLIRHEEEDQLVENRVLKVEIERSIEREQAKVREVETAVHRRKVLGESSRVSAIAGSATSIIIQILKATWDSYHH